MDNYKGDFEEGDPIANESFTTEDVKNNPQGIVDYANSHPYSQKAVDDEKFAAYHTGKQEYNSKLREFINDRRGKRFTKKTYDE